MCVCIEVSLRTACFYKKIGTYAVIIQLELCKTGKHMTVQGILAYVSTCALVFICTVIRAHCIAIFYAYHIYLVQYHNWRNMCGISTFTT